MANEKVLPALSSLKFTPVAVILAFVWTLYIIYSQFNQPSLIKYVATPNVTVTSQKYSADITRLKREITFLKRTLAETGRTGSIRLQRELQHAENKLRQAERRIQK